MNRKGDMGGLLTWYVAYFILGILFFSGVYFWVNSFGGRVALVEDFYSKELARVLNGAEPGQEVYFDITRAAQLASKNGLREQDLISFDNERHSVTVRLSASSGTTFSYFNDVTVRPDYRAQLSFDDDSIVRLHFVVEGAVRES